MPLGLTEAFDASTSGVCEMERFVELAALFLMAAVDESVRE